MDDLVLIEMAKGGDNRAYASLLNKYQNRLFYFVLLKVRNYWDAEDVTMESFEKAFSGLHNFVPRAKFSTWLFQIATNHCIDFLRKKNTIPHMDEIDLKYVRISYNLEEQIIGEETMRLVNDEISRLSTPLKRVFALYVHGLKYREISEKLNVPMGTVQAYVHRTKHQLQKRIA